MDPYAEQLWAFTLNRKLRLQQCSGPDLRPLLARRFRVVRPQRGGEGALVDDVLAGLLRGISASLHGRRARARRRPTLHLLAVDIEPSDLREGMTLELWWTDTAGRFGEYNLPVYGPPSTRG
jgi:hypothetical protein